MSTTVDDRLIRRMFLAQRIGLMACVPIGLALAFSFMMPPAIGATGTLGRILITVASWGSVVLSGAAILSVFVVVLASLATCCLVYSVGRRDLDGKYAVTHLLLCLALIPTLVGPLFMPLLVGNDIERFREETAQSPVSNPSL